MRKCEPNGLITLTTDFGMKEPFVGAMKGVIYSINRKASPIDITHDIAPQDISSTSFLLNAFHRSYPKGTIHLVVVDPGVGGQRRSLAIQTEDYYFVAPDNGVLTESLSFKNGFSAVSLENDSYFLPDISNTFHGRDIFAPVAAYLSKGVLVSELGPLVTDLTRIAIPTPEFKKDRIRGQIRYIDRFGNLITNIRREDLLYFCNAGQFTIRVKKRLARCLFHSYESGAEKEDFIALFNSFNLLELALYERNAAMELNAVAGDEVLVEQHTYKNV